MYLLDFLKTHNISDLEKPPYNIKVSFEYPYIMLKYNQIESDLSLSIVQECRGIILKEDRIVCRPFDKFFNYGESNAANLAWNSGVIASEKIDGSLIKLWYDNGWHLSTNGTIDAFKAKANTVMKYSFGDLFMNVLDEHLINFNELTSHLNQGFTHMFELVSPYSRVVIPYKKTDVYYLCSRDNIDGTYYKDSRLEELFLTPKELLRVYSIDQLLPIVEAMDWQHEGFVLYDGVNRIKLKSPAYVLAHYARANGNVSRKHLVKVILENEVDEFLTYADEYKNTIDEIKNIMARMAIQALNFKEAVRIKYRAGLDRKNFAAWNKTQLSWLQDFGFKLYDNINLTWVEYTDKYWTLEKWCNELDQYLE